MPPEKTVDAAVKTYDYLRMAVVGMSLLLLVAIGIEMATGIGWLGSISAYYYTPVRSVFVGVLVAMGLALIAIKGRDRNSEDLLLNVAGMLAPIVAFAPTPLVHHSDYESGWLASTGLVPDGLDCAPKTRCMPEDFAESLVNNIWALVVVGLAGWGLAWWMARRDWQSPDTDEDFKRRSKRGLGIGLLVIIVFLAAFVAARPTFLALAHYVSAIAMFGALILVVRINAHESPTKVSVMAKEVPFKRFYEVIWMVMAAVLAGTAAYGAFLLVDGRAAWSKLVFVLEVVLLVPFIVFWALQTIQFFRKGVPPEESSEESAERGLGTPGDPALGGASDQPT